jgi:DNA topoisomerase IB
MRRPPRTPRLRRSDCSGPGIRRRRRGRGFQYLTSSGDRITDEPVLARIRELAIPPAWRDVWICPDERGHLQATGIDAAGRKQYLYHPVWRELRDRQKFAEMERFAAALPKLRRRVSADLGSSEELTRERVLACAARLLDLGLFRVGGEEYAEQNGSLGLATLRREHVSLRDGEALFDYPAKSGVRRTHTIGDDDSLRVLAGLRRRRGGPEELLAYRAGRRWSPLRSDDINDYIKSELGEEFSAKDFRTWNATVLAAAALASRRDQARSATARNRVIGAVAREVSEMLGNTPAIARRSYIDPRVFDRYLSGWTIAAEVAAVEPLDGAGERRRRRLERAVLDLLAEDGDSRAVQIASAVAA